jgi:hypothetical protein
LQGAPGNGWSCNDNTGGWSEALTITHTSKTNGGVVCCKDGGNGVGVSANDRKALSFLACQGGLSAKPTCTAGKVVRMLDVVWGRADATTCNSKDNAKFGLLTKFATSSSILGLAISRCEGKTSCELPPSATILGEIDSTIAKYVQGVYECIDPITGLGAGMHTLGEIDTLDADSDSSETPVDPVTSFDPSVDVHSFGPYCENTAAQIYCPSGFLVQIDSASYGRSDSTTCADHDADTITDTQCSSSTAATLLSDRCDGQDSCEFLVDGAALGDDPCPGTYKYVSGTYKCLINNGNDWKVKTCHDPEGIRQTVYLTPAEIKAGGLASGDFVGSCSATTLVTVTLGVDFASIADLEEFKAQFLADLYRAAGVDASIGVFFISSVVSGSTIVNVEVRPSAYVGDVTIPAPDAIANDLVAQSQDPTSALLNGNVTSSVLSVYAESSSGGDKTDYSLAIGLGVAGGVIFIAIFAIVIYKFCGKRTHARVHSHEAGSHANGGASADAVPSAKQGASADVESGLGGLPTNKGNLDKLASDVAADAERERMWVFTRDSAAAKGASP